MSRPSLLLFLVFAAACAPPAPPAAPSKTAGLACDGTTVRAGSEELCLVKTRRTFDDASHDCERMHGRLALVKDDAENRAILAAIGSSWGYGSGLWLGCSDSEKEGSWVCAGKPAAFTNWAAGQPDNETALDDCLEWLPDEGKWNDATCDWALGYLCKGDATLRCSGRKVTAGAAVFCANGGEPGDWDAAKKACAAAGGKLAVVESADEARALVDALGSKLGIPSWRPGEGVWIGLSDTVEEGKFVGVDGAPLGYANWAKGQPDDSGGGEDCVTLTLGDGKWNDVGCGKPLPYLCEGK